MIPTQKELNEVKSKNKLRDLKIIKLYAQEGMTMEPIAKMFGISSIRVGQILYKNAHLVKINADFQKIKRIHHLERLLAKNPEVMAKKSTIDILEQLRKEVEGDKGISVAQTVVVQMGNVQLANGEAMEYNVGSRMPEDTRPT